LLDVKYILLKHFGIKPWELNKLKTSEIIYFINRLSEELTPKKKILDWQGDIDAFYRNKKEINNA